MSVVLAACSDGSEPEPAAPSTPTPATTTPAIADRAPTTTPEPGDPAFTISGKTVWQEVLSTLAASDQNCIRVALAKDQLQQTLDQTPESEGDTQEWEVSMFSCLAPQTARELFIGVLAGVAEEAGIAEVDEESRTCMRESLADFDMAALMAADLDSDADITDLAEAAVTAMACAPKLLLSVLHDLLADSPDPASDTALDGSVSEVDDDHANSAEEASATEIGEATPGAIYPQTDIDFFAFEADAGQLYQIDIEPDTLLDSVAVLYDADGSELSQNDDYFESLASRIHWEAEYSGTHHVAVQSYDSFSTGSYTLTIAEIDVDDDHTNMVEGASTIEIGEATPGTIDYEADIDFFAFEAYAGQLYQIDVDRDTLAGSTVAIYDADGLYLESYDFVASLWLAEYTGTHHLAVQSYDRHDTGSYTLTIAEIDVDDDHGDTVEGASTIEIGEATPGTIDYEADIDFFAFEADEGQLYQINVELDTLSDSRAGLYDAGGSQLAYDDQVMKGSRIYWEAEYTGTLHIAVQSYDTYSTGSYTLTIVAR